MFFLQNSSLWFPQSLQLAFPLPCTLSSYPQSSVPSQCPGSPLVFVMPICLEALRGLEGTCVSTRPTTLYWKEKKDALGLVDGTLSHGSCQFLLFIFSLKPAQSALTQLGTCSFVFYFFTLISILAWIMTWWLLPSIFNPFGHIVNSRSRVFPLTCVGKSTCYSS